MIELYQFQFSHYCEKARWALDYKGVSYTLKNLLPGLHIKAAQKLAPKTHLPILIDAGKVVQDSTEIISYLDRKRPERPLTPENPTQAKAALEWEEYLDEEIGATLRLWFYYYLLPDRKRALRFMLDGAPWYGRPLFAVIFPKVRSRMITYMKINTETASCCELRFLAALDRLDDALKNHSYLIGDRFSRADLTACALLSPLCLPSDVRASTDFPEPVYVLRDQHKNRRFFDWVQGMYRDHRRPSPADVSMET